MRKTKIVGTLGPTSSDPEMMRRLMQAGLNVARLNFSHGTHAEHRARIRMLRKIAAELDRPLAILLDLKGPKIRIGALAGDVATLTAGRPFTLTNRPMEGNEQRVSVSYAELPREVKPGDTIMLADGTLELGVERVTETDVECRVVIGGLISSHKGVNLLTGSLKVPAITDKDIADMAVGLEEEVDYIALSFVRAAADIEQARAILREANSDIPIIAKIEKHEALEHIEEIINAADGVMVARGDLGVEIPLEEVPLAQKNIIRTANLAGKPVITATQMLKSMVENPRPTRAEVTDIANAILDGTDALMLSEETAVGRYAVEAVAMMSKIAERVEQSAQFTEAMQVRRLTTGRRIGDAISHAACSIAEELGAKAIISPTLSGRTARMVSRYRPPQTIFALSTLASTVQRLALVWGVSPCLQGGYSTTPELIENSKQLAKREKIARSGDVIVITAGIPIGVSGKTNLIRVAEIE